MTVLRPSPVSTRGITYASEDNLLVAEASSIGIGHDLDFGRVYDDACDEGLTLVSHLTGREVTYAVNHAERRDGDLLYWDLIPADARERGLPTFRIYND